MYASYLLLGLLSRLGLPSLLAFLGASAIPSSWPLWPSWSLQPYLLLGDVHPDAGLNSDDGVLLLLIGFARQIAPGEPLEVDDARS